MFFDGEPDARRIRSQGIGDVSNIYRLYHPTTRSTTRGRRSSTFPKYCMSLAKRGVLAYSDPPLGAVSAATFLSYRLQLQVADRSRGTLILKLRESLPASSIVATCDMRQIARRVRDITNSQTISSCCNSLSTHQHVCWNTARRKQAMLVLCLLQGNGSAN